MKTLTNVVIYNFNENEINLSFDLDGAEYSATLSIVSHDFKILDESFTHAFGIRRDFSYEFDAKLNLTDLEDSEGEETTIDDDVLAKLKNAVIDEMQEQSIQKMYDTYN